MALDPARVRDLAAQLDVAERERRQIRQFSLEHPDIGLQQNIDRCYGVVAEDDACVRRSTAKAN